MLGVLPGLRTSYQRTPAWPPVRLTEWLSTSDSVPPLLRYATRCIRRSPSPSRPTVVPGCGTHERVLGHNWLKALVVSVVGPVKVELEGVVQFTLNLKK